MFETPPSQVHYCYGAWQDGFRPMKDEGFVFHEGIPDHQELAKWFPKGRGVLVLDDLMDEGSGDKHVLDLFTKHSHHQNITVLYLCQDMFPVGEICQKHFPQCSLHRGIQKPPGSIGCTKCLVAIVSLRLERLFGNLSHGNIPLFWVLGFGFAPGLVG